MRVLRLEGIGTCLILTGISVRHISCNHGPTETSDEADIVCISARSLPELDIFFALYAQDRRVRRVQRGDRNLAQRRTRCRQVCWHAVCVSKENKTVISQMYVSTCATRMCFAISLGSVCTISNEVLINTTAGRNCHIAYLAGCVEA